MEENIERTCKLKVKENMECEMRKREKEMTLCTENAHHVVKVRVRIKEEYKEKCLGFLLLGSLELGLLFNYTYFIFLYITYFHLYFFLVALLI